MNEIKNFKPKDCARKKLKVFVVGDDFAYANFITEPFELTRNIKLADIFIFTGGEDVTPGLYGESAGMYTSYNLMRDRTEVDRYNEIQMKKQGCGPYLIIGICRGAQLLTVLNGGMLYQHVENHAIHGTHKILLVNEGYEIDITSTHHQMMRLDMISGDKYVLIARTPENMSKTHLNGENTNVVAGFEPEIVFFHNTNCLCIQGHPEYMSKSSDAVKYLNVLISELLEK